MPTPIRVPTLLKILPELPVEHSVLLRGDHGIGKSSIVRQVSRILSEREGQERPFLDRRLSQMQAGDLLGLPSIEGRSTRWNPPDWVRLACDRACDVHLDELNRADREVMQSAFQLVLDRELAGNRLHPGTRVYASINARSVYDVQPIDPALLDRFVVYDVALTIADWAEHARLVGIHPEIVSWVQRCEQFFIPPAGSDPAEKQPSPRSLERASRAAHRQLERFDRTGEVDRESLANLIGGYLGIPAAASFVHHLLSDARLTALDVLERWDEVRKTARTHRVDLMQDLIDRVVAHVGGHVVLGVPLTGEETDEPVVPTPEQAAWAAKAGPNIEMFLWDCHAELRPTFFQKLAALGIDRMPLIESLHPYFVRPIVEGSFGVLPRAGIVGVQASAAE